MSQWMPFGADTLVIPFEIVGRKQKQRPSGGMSRMHAAGELYRYGVAPTEDFGPNRSYAPVPRRWAGSDLFTVSEKPASPRRERE